MRVIRQDTAADLIYHIIYNMLLVAAYPLLLVFFAWAAVANHKYTGTMKERFGFYRRRPAGGATWLHAVSVGEAVGATPLIRTILERDPAAPLVVTTTTKGGMEVLRKTFGDSVVTAYFPLDFPWVIARAVRAFRPRALILMETEIWPNLVSQCRRSGAPVLLLNGRVSDRMASSGGAAAGLYRHVFSLMSALGMQTGADAERLKRLGADPSKIHIVGNMKFDGMMTELDSEKIGELRRTAAADGAPLFVAGSTHPGEEEIMLGTLDALKAEYPGMRLVIAPRHIERSPEVMELCRGAGRDVELRSERGPDRPCGGDIVVWDTIGELRYLYSLAAACFVGGSLIRRGGHNILEPAACGKAAFYGPHMANFKASVDALESGGGGKCVEGGGELADSLLQYLGNDDLRKKMDAAALDVVKRNAGASERAYELYREFA